VLEARDLSAVCFFYRMALQARAIEHAARHHRDMAQFMAQGAIAAGELGASYAEHVLFLSTAEARA
jgi:hypothetical protein